MKRVAGLLCATCVAAFAGSLAAPVSAAELPLKAPPPPPASWTGPYFGANVDPGVGKTPFYDIYGPNPDYALDADPKTSGWLGGFQLGYNYQLNQFVFGVQGDFDWGGIKKDFSCFSFGNQSCTSDDEWLASLTGRFGPLIGPALLYVDGGAAWTRTSISDIASGAQVCVPTGGTTVCSSPGDLFQGSGIFPGWTVGGGVEYRFSPFWSVFLEYDYFDFGQHAITLTDGGTGTFPESVKQTLQLIRFGFNYALDDPPSAAAPAPAWYDDSAKAIRAFSLLDVGKDSVDGLVGGMFAFGNNFDTSGPRLWITGGAGAYRYPAGNEWIRGVYSTGDLLGGYGFEGNTYEINVLLGGSAENDMLSAYDPSNAVNGTAVGVKARADVWYNPTPRQLIYAEGEYTTAFQTYYTSARYGYDFFNKGFFIGPEVSAFGDERYDQWRVGGTITQIRLGTVEVDLSAGFAHDSSVGEGAYGHVSVSKDF
jgi:outer membrane immunogenic protein